MGIILYHHNFVGINYLSCFHGCTGGCAPVKKTKELVLGRMLQVNRQVVLVPFLIV